MVFLEKIKTSVAFVQNYLISGFFLAGGLKLSKTQVLRSKKLKTKNSENKNYNQKLNCASIEGSMNV